MDSVALERTSGQSLAAVGFTLDKRYAVTPSTRLAIKYQALTGTVLTGKFSLDVFKGRIYVCFNEAPTLPDPAKALLGNYIKDEWVGGEGKNDKASTIRNLARIAVTTNRMDFNINVKSLPVGSQERALFAGESIHRGSQQLA